MSILNKIYENWADLMNKYSDPRTSDWLFMSSPFPTIWICILYVYIVKEVGPNIMKNRKPFKLKYILILYNLAQVILSFYIFWEGLTICWLWNYNWRCEPVDFSRSETAMRIARGCYVYYISKFTEFFDTFFFILRKRFDQVSTLHVIHHGIMPFSAGDYIHTFLNIIDDYDNDFVFMN
ncbi:unnamed protein product [Chironomus riparius]|uniref:Elongation of very long chain fatty acids protein n=1 Tax=Chironomus riparius TaxID=315576 RepID=A0A9N9WN09_9DIPT|nr:unnamed protein product [Chironomus riparius]